MFAFLSILNLWAMPDAKFENFTIQLDETSFASNKISLIKLVSQHNTFTSRQVKQTLALMSFASDRLDALQIMAPKIEDPENGFLILSAFKFSSNKDKAQKMLATLSPKKTH